MSDTERRARKAFEAWCAEENYITDSQEPHGEAFFAGFRAALSVPPKRRQPVSEPTTGRYWSGTQVGGRSFVASLDELIALITEATYGSISGVALTLDSGETVTINDVHWSKAVASDE